MKILLRGKTQGITYREVLHGGSLIAAIWKTPRDGNERYSVVTPTTKEPKTFATLSAAKRWVAQLIRRQYGMENR